MSNVQSPFRQMETACGSLLHELQIIWDEIGESDAEKDRMLLELEQECLEIYGRKVDRANTSRVQLRKLIAEAEAEIADICSTMGERSLHIRQSDQNPKTLKAKLGTVLAQAEELRKRKGDRKKQFTEVLEQIHDLESEIYGSTENSSTEIVVDETDLSLRKLEESYRVLHALHKEKSERLKQVLDHMNSLNSLCSVLGLDFKQIISEVHPSLGKTECSKDISNDTIEQLEVAILRLRELKLQKMQRLQDLAASLLELWNLMDTPIEEQQTFQKATCNLVASEDEITDPDMLSIDYINSVEVEVSRLEELKASKMKEIVSKKQSELEDICRKTHLIPESDPAMDVVIDAIETGVVDAASVLEQIELEIAKVKEEALSRKEILERVEKWIAACEEEKWLEEYNRDENRYNAGRGTHLNLKRAEKARVIVTKVPAMVDALASKVTTWQNERGTTFTYNGMCLLSMLEEYTTLRQEKEQERKRQRDQKKLQGQLLAEQEVLYGSKSSPMKTPTVKKPGLSGGGVASNRSLSFNGSMVQTPNTPRTVKKNERVNPDHLRDEDTLKMRKPFTPITDSSKSNATNTLDDPNDRNIEPFHKTLPSINTPYTIPSKKVSATEEENRTPKTHPTHIEKSSEDAEAVEYSFEECRAGFGSSTTHLENTLRVS